MNSPEDGPVGPKHVEIRRYMNKIETVTSVGFSFPKQYGYLISLCFVVYVGTEITKLNGIFKIL